MRETVLKPGDTAPDFLLPDHNDNKISLSGLAGKRVLLSFHPLAWTPVCEVQMRTLEIKHALLEKLNTVALGLSVDGVFSKKAWARHMGVEKTSLLADFWPHGQVAAQYGLFIEKLGFSGRANVLIDPAGKVEQVWVYEIPEVPDIESVIRFLAK